MTKIMIYKQAKKKEKIENIKNNLLLSPNEFIKFRFTHIFISFNRFNYNLDDILVIIKNNFKNKHDDHSAI